MACSRGDEYWNSEYVLDVMLTGSADRRGKRKE